MAPKPVAHNWNISKGDYYRDENYDKLYFDGRRRKKKILKLLLAGLSMAFVIITNVVLLNLSK